MPFVKVSRLLAGIVGATIGLLPVAPPEHVHETEDQGHIHTVIHRHLQPHGNLEHHADRQSAFDDDDGPVLTLTAVYTVPVSLVAACPPPRIVNAWIEPPKPHLVEWPFADVDLLIHGPPRAPKPPRAPPSFLTT